MRARHEDDCVRHSLLQQQTPNLTVGRFGAAGHLSGACSALNTMDYLSIIMDSVKCELAEDAPVVGDVQVPCSLIGGGASHSTRTLTRSSQF